MNIVIERGKVDDLDEVEALYNSLNDYLDKETNYPGWKKGIYPIREDGAKGIRSGDLYIARHRGAIVASMILNHIAEVAYDKVIWKEDLDYQFVFLVRTFLVHPDYLKQGIGSKFLDYAINYGKISGMKSIRLDVFENNRPAINLYEKKGFEYIGNVDLGLESYGLNSFCLYELTL